MFVSGSEPCESQQLCLAAIYVSMSDDQPFLVLVYIAISRSKFDLRTS